MGITDPQAGVEFIWEQFENRTSEAQKVLKELQNFPEVTSEDPDNLWKFSIVCMQARKLASTEQGGALLIRPVHSPP